MNKTLLQIALFTLLLIVLGLFSTVNAQFAGGSGTEADPYQVETAEQLDTIRNNLDSHFILIADIDLDVAPYNSGEGWAPIGSEVDHFKGTLDGNGHTINNLYIDRNTGDLGLFVYIGDGGQVSTIRITNANVTSTEARVGILAGYLNGNVTKTHVSGNVSGTARVGGLAGAADENSTITEVSANINVVSTNERAGGLLGTNRGDISNSYAYGSVNGSARVGGLIGNGFSPATVFNNYVAVELNGGGFTGGLVGTDPAVHIPTIL